MMNRKLFVVVVLALGIITYISSCKKSEDSQPLEPISLVQPDSAIIRKFPGDSMTIQLKFTTDRPINWIKGMYDVDTTTRTTGLHTTTYPDTLFFVKLDTLNPRVNLYTYTGSYFLPDTLNPYDVIRFKVSFEAGKSTFSVGQNYPKGIVGQSKEFRVDVR
jgi:hypothetical protein